MILLNGDLRFGFGVMTDNKAIRTYFKGMYLRSVPATVIDLSNGGSSIGVLYVCAGNVLFCLQVRGSHAQIYQLQPSDTFQSIDQDNELLRRAMNDQAYGQTLLQVKTSHPINYLKLNDRYLLIVDIMQPDNPDVGTHMYGAETIVVDKGYIIKNTNLLAAMDAVLNGKAFDPKLPLPGNDMQRSAFLRYLPVMLIVLFVFAVMLLTALRQAGG